MIRLNPDEIAAASEAGKVAVVTWTRKWRQVRVMAADETAIESYLRGFDAAGEGECEFALIVPSAAPQPTC